MKSREKISDVKSLCDLIWRVEEEFSLNDFEIRGVKAWQYIRVKIYYYLAEKAGIFISPHESPKGWLAITGRAYRMLLGSVVNNPFLLKSSNVDEVIIEHPRCVFFNGVGVDIYSNYYVKNLNEMGVKYCLLDPPGFDGKHQKGCDSSRSFLDFFALSSLAMSFTKSFGMIDERKVIMKVNNKFSSELGVEVDLGPMLFMAAKRFLAKYRLYKNLFKRLNPKRVVLVIGYGNGDAIKAAKDLNIETVEIQHGTFSRFHLGYSYPNKCDQLDYFPDAFLAWGQYWREMNVLPIAKCKIKVMPFQYFNNILKEKSGVSKDEKKVVILSQGAIGDKISELVYSFRDELSGYKVFYKLHPGEYTRWREYKHLNLLADMPNVTIVTDGCLHEHLASASYQIGVFSTAVYEGIGFGCTTILLDIPGVEYMADLIDNDLARLVRTPGDIARVFREDKVELKGLNSDAIFG